MNTRRSLFVLDTNIFIDAHRRFYAFDLCPGFWECLEHYCREGQVRRIDQVRDEIVSDEEQPRDQLSEWVNQAPDALFVLTAEQSILNAFTEMSNWALENRQFRSQAQEEFVNVADGWVAAYAKVHNSVVVTHEMFNVDVKKESLCLTFANSLASITATLSRCCTRLTYDLTGSGHNARRQNLIATESAEIETEYPIFDW